MTRQNGVCPLSPGLGENQSGGTPWLEGHCWGSLEGASWMYAGGAPEARKALMC